MMPRGRSRHSDGSTRLDCCCCRDALAFEWWRFRVGTNCEARWRRGRWGRRHGSYGSWRWRHAMATAHSCREASCCLGVVLPACISVTLPRQTTCPRRSIALLRRRSALGSGSTQSRYLADLRERYGGIDSVLVTGSGLRQAADTVSAAAKCR